jgi:hypothetical protein
VPPAQVGYLTTPHGGRGEAHREAPQTRAESLQPSICPAPAVSIRREDASLGRLVALSTPPISSGRSPEAVGREDCAQAVFAKKTARKTVLVRRAHRI